MRWYYVPSVCDSDTALCCNLSSCTSIDHVPVLSMRPSTLTDSEVPGYLLTQLLPDIVGLPPREGRTADPPWP
jgi:hypothetical protein